MRKILIGFALFFGVLAASVPFALAAADSCNWNQQPNGKYFRVCGGTQLLVGTSFRDFAGAQQGFH
jgi:hypothetical protein